MAFGLVSLPVKLYSAGNSASKIRFNQINRETGARVRHQKVDAGSGEPVDVANLVKGYEFAKDQYVTFEPDELQALDAAGAEEIAIAEFVPASEVDRIYLEKTYYLGPSRGGGRAYRLLSAALKETERVAIARYTARGRQRLVMIRPADGGLVMEQLLYSDEVRSFGEVPVEDGEVGEAELQLARQLIEQASSDSFDPDSYRDEVREKVQALIDRKIEGEQITTIPQEQPETQIIDLMEALQASLAKKGRTTSPEAKTSAGAPETAEAAEPKRAAAGG